MKTLDDWEYRLELMGAAASEADLIKHLSVAPNAEAEYLMEYLVQRACGRLPFQAR